MAKIREQIVKVVFILSIPIVIILGVVRLVATEPYLSFEYSKPGFPEDLFGFDRSMRIAHAADNIQFVTSKQSLDDLAGQKHNNSLLYNFRELKHMLDVKNTYQTTLQVWYLMLAVSAVSGIALIARKEKRPDFASALRWGGALTVGLLMVIGLAAVLAWQGWFVVFHRLFFELGSWTFDVTDTLIRLFPEKFWYDTALTLSGLSIVIGILTYWTGSRLSKRYASRYEPSTLLGSAPSETPKISSESGQEGLKMITQAKYIPALSFSWLTPLFDLFIKLGMRERSFKRRLIQQANIRSGMRVLDLGCGTGTLTIMIKQTYPNVEVVGLDGDQAILEIARSKANRAGVKITFDNAMAFKLPYPDNSFNRVLSSLVIHHLSTENKQLAMHEIYRVLRAGGELHIVDFGKPHNPYAHLVSLVIRHLEEASDNIRGLIPEMIHNAGFTKVEKTAQYTTIVGGLTLFRAKV